MADIKINGNTYTGVTKLLAKKSDGNGEQAFVIPELESRTVNLGSSAPSSVTPSAGKDGISSVDFSIDSTVIAPGNIAKGVTVLGVAGTLEAGGSAPQIVTTIEAVSEIPTMFFVVWLHGERAQTGGGPVALPSNIPMPDALNDMFIMFPQGVGDITESQWNGMTLRTSYISAAQKLVVTFGPLTH